MQISMTTGIIMVLITSFMWGSWFQFIRRIGKWPVAAFMLCLYTFSFFIVWIAVFVLQKTFIPDGILNTMKGSPGMCMFILICGAISSMSTQISMMVVSKVGLVFSTSITAMFSIPYGFLLSSYFGGIPDNISVFRLVLGVVFLLVATLLCQKSTHNRDIDQGKVIEKGDKTNAKHILVILLCTLFLSPAYTLAMSIGTKTTLRPNGLPPVLLVGVLSGGALIGTWVFSSIRLTKNKQWDEAFSRKNKKYIGYAMISGFCHYGGNMIHTIAIPALSMAIAWPLGMLSSVWQYLWGIAQGEYKNVSVKTGAFLASGILFFLLALITLTSALYWNQ